MVAKPRTSRRRIAELSLVLRALVDEFETAGIRRVAGHRAALDLADAFARTELVTKTALDAVRADVAREKARYGAMNAVLYTQYAGLPIASLLLMVERGDDESEHVLTYASYSVLGADSAAGKKRIEALRSDAAEHVGAIDDAPLPVVEERESPRAQAAESALLARSRAGLSPEAVALLERLGSFRDAKQTTDSETLAKLLRELDYPVSESVLAFEETFGGLLLPTTRFDDWRKDRRHTLVGPWAALRSGFTIPPRGGEHGAATKLVPVALGRQDDVYFLDERGAAYYHETVGEPSAIPFGIDGAELVTRLVAAALTYASEDRDGTAVFPSAAQIAKVAVGIGLTRLFADETSEWWSGPTAVVVVFRGQAWGLAWTDEAVAALSAASTR